MSKSRRQLLKSLGALSVVGIAGCSGDGTSNGDGGDESDGESGGEDGGSSDGSSSDGGSSDGGNNDGGSSDGGSTDNNGSPISVTWASSSTETSAYAMCQGVAQVVDENSDTVQVSAQPSQGPRANIGVLQREEADVAHTSAWTASQVLQGEDPFGDVSYEMRQLFRYYTIQIFPITPNMEWETASDIESGSRIFPGSMTSVNGRITTYVLDEYVLDDYEVVEIGYDQQAGQFKSGGIDVGQAGYVFKDLEAPWTTQTYNQMDIKALPFSDSVIDELRNDDKVPLTEVDLSSYDYDHPGSVLALHQPMSVICRADQDEEFVYELSKAVFENRDSLSEYHAFLKYWDEDHFVSDVFPAEFHPGAADFFEEAGLM